MFDSHILSVFPYVTQHLLNVFAEDVPTLLLHCSHEEFLFMQISARTPVLQYCPAELLLQHLDEALFGRGQFEQLISVMIVQL